MAPIDYSRFQGMADDDDDDEPARGPARVTRLDGPTTISVGPQRTVIEPRSAAGAPALSAVPHAYTTNASKPKPSGLDYGRWDKLDLSDDEDADDRDAAAFEDAQLGGDEEEEDEFPSPEEMAVLRERVAREKAADDAERAAMPPPPPPPKYQGAPSAADQKRAKALADFEALRARLTRNGAAREGHLWRQTEAEAELSVLLPAGTRARDVRPELVQADLLGGGKQRLVVHRAAPGGGGAGAPFFEAELAYPVADAADAEELAWELTDYESPAAGGIATGGGRRVLRVTLAKDSPHGVVVWWERALVGEEAVDTLTLPDRKRAGNVAAQQDVWAEATRMFKEKVAKRAAAGPTLVDVDPGLRAEMLEEAAAMRAEEGQGEAGPSS